MNKQNTDAWSDYGTFMSQLKRSDKRQRQMFGSLTIVFTLFFLAKVIEAVDILLQGVNETNVWILLEVLTFVIILYPFRRIYLQFKNVDYGVPTTIMLQRTIRRYKHVRVGDFLLAGLFIVTKISSMVINHNLNASPFMMGLFIIVCC
ncbi:hypothetical protein OAT16_01725, partial [Prolixibacteraceae bacterium]|nr:hypothetical protein [Prolixibacteraceae bacterium]